MTYVFSGLIGFDRTLDWEGLMEGLGGVQRDLDTPFEGRVHALGADYRLHEPAPWERDIVAAFSRSAGNSPLIGLVVECFGGLCEQRAVVWRGGERGRSWETSRQTPSALEQALAEAGHPVTSPRMVFLERGFFDFDHVANMRRALALARSNWGKTGENPSVGCVLIDARGELIAEAVTAPGGRPHAEEQTLEEAGSLAEGATAYVTLEPCRERSTGEMSCSETLIAAGVSSVHIATRDPHPKGAGGLDRLRAAAIAVTLGTCKGAADVLYQDFFTRVRDAGDAPES
ncbi:MAG: bifunctional diaminohydroxyphosphoribosylaminopyrimidine deaminase/5-amino-6-(5-phosphoribosylamino)uracil reductase RibD [Pseudomonadota bacterium]